MALVYFTRFEAKEEAGGGCRRFGQTYELLSGLGHIVVETTRDLQTANKILGTRHHWRTRIERKVGGFRRWNRDYFDSIYNCRQFSRHWKAKYRNAQGIDLAIVDDPLHFEELYLHLIRKRIPVVAVSQNIESISSSQIHPAHIHSLFKKEMRLFQMAALCLAISREEAFLLKNFGVNVLYYPYYPVAGIENRLQAIRLRRGKRKEAKRGLLFVGTMNNLPTRDGLLELVRFWNESRISSETEHPLFICGYGTRKMKNLVPQSDRTVLLGDIPDHDLDTLMGEVACAVIHQDRGAGALTKITEFLIADLPVVASAHALRSHYQGEGVFEYQALSLDFAEALRKALSGHRSIPVPKRADDRPVRTLLGNLLAS